MSLQSLRRLAELVAKPGDVADISAAAVDAAMAATRADRAALFAIDTNEVMQPLSSRRFSKEACVALAGFSPWPPAPGEARSVFEADVLRGWALGSAREAIGRAGMRSLAFLPVVSRGRLLGALALSYDEPHVFTDDEVQLAELIAHQAATGLDRALADRSIHARGEFLATLGHELRNPLNALLNAASILERPTSGDPVRTMASAIIRRQTAHVARLLDDLLDEARLSRGLLDLQRAPCDVRAAATAAVEELSHRVEAKRQDLEVILPGEPVVVDGDPTRLRQVVSNLLDNASKYAPANGVIRLSLAAEAEQAVLRVTDSGPGVPADRLSVIFEPLVQGISTIARSDGGLGLGLSIVKRIVELHGGTVGAHNRGGEGRTEFVVRLPLAPARRAEA